MGGAVGNLAGGITDIFGMGDSEENRTTRQTNESKQTNQTQLGAASNPQITAQQVSDQQFGDLSKQLNNYFSSAQGDSDAINNLFKQALTKFATGTGQPSPDQLQQATQYVDQTFTAPAQTQYNRFLDQAQSQIANRAAQLGRSSSDIGYQREFAGQAGAAAEDLANQRGSLIGQRSDYLTNQLPQNQLSQLLQGSQYFNTPLNQALQNRLSLLNASTAQQNTGLQGQIAAGKTTQTGNQAGSTIVPEASMSTKLYNFGSAWNQQDASIIGGASSGAKAFA